MLNGKCIERSSCLGKHRILFVTWDGSERAGQRRIHRLARGRHQGTQKMRQAPSRTGRESKRAIH